ncbi:ComF family protein [Zunongwangia sp. SCSIO 43204]|uniref:ComF family protein n=1 Tax=Zunongwangia mangrovi TaxID=1334022 RepID=A0A1I1D8E6_9FLAO|nr:MULTISPECIES: phosphoribosyltransferase family protein [Zunongwangia]UAB84897.1 ComF family protein [Zunongwangia sp. SCSIO 43204]SFB71067.1 comF family protein [Zunongwangia mangrovi]
MFHDFINLFYPKTCNCCERPLLDHEKVICTSCLHQLPLTNFQPNNENQADKVFYGRAEINAAYALLLFRKKNMVQLLLHQLKYKRQFEISYFLGEWTGEILKNSSRFTNIDMVIPVPLHKKRLKERGYNQTEGFAKEIAKSLNAEYRDDLLTKTSSSKKQALKNRISRWNLMEQSFQLTDASAISGKHILLVDDILTTGATLEACINCLRNSEKIKISIATMAITI